jgi:protein-L-isoaspartate(D-aspartate) O-methyltransferase
MPELNTAQARRNMVERQIRPWEVLDERVLKAMASVPRERFVPADWRDSAYSDASIPLPGGRSLLPPSIIARGLQALAPRADEAMLVIGDASGYVIACAAQLAHHAYGVEADPAQAAMAARHLRDTAVFGARCDHGNALAGWPALPSWPAILIAGAVREVPTALREQMRQGGRLFAIVGDPKSPVMHAQLLQRIGPRDWQTRTLFETHAALLPEAEASTVTAV